MARASTFTSYINADLEGDVDAKWKRYEQLATRTYDNIGKAAADANRQLAGLQGGRGLAGGGTAMRSNTSAAAAQARQMRAIDEVNRRVTRSTEQTTRAFSRQSREMATTADRSNRVARGLSAVSTSLNVVQGPLGPLAGRVSALSRAVAELTGFRLGLAGVASSLFVLGQVGNTYAGLDSRLRGTYVTQREVNRAMNDVVGIASRTRSALDPVAETYIKLTKAGEDFNISQERSARLAELVSKAVKLSGGSTQSQEAALTQFGQGFASNNLSGDELKSIRENAFVLAQAIANGMDVTIGELKQLGAEGELTAERLADALDKSALEIEARFASMPKTLGQGFTELSNSITLLVGGFDQAVGFSSKVGQVISGLAANLDKLAMAAVFVGTTFAAIKMQAFISQTVSATRQTLVMNAAVTQLGQRRLQAATAAQQSAQRSIAALNGEQAEINETIALERRRAQLARRDRERVQRDPGRTNAALKAAIEEERIALQRLSAARQNAATTAAGLAAAQDRLTQATNRVTAAQTAASARTGVFRTAIRNLIGAINPMGIAIGLVTTALITMMTRTSQAEQTLSKFSEETVTAAQKAIGLATANRDLAESYYEIARAMGRKAVAEAKQEARANREELGGQLRQAGLLSGPGAERERLNALAAQVERGEADFAKVRAALSTFRKNNNTLLQDWTADIGLGIDLREEAIDNSLVANELANRALKSAQEDQADIAKRIAEDQEEANKPKVTPAAPVSAADLRTQAAVDAINGGTNDLVAARRRRAQALKELDEELGVSKGKVPGENAEEYRSRAAEIERTFDMEKQAIASARAARTAASRTARQEARQAIKDAREEAAAKRDLALLDLEKQKPGMDQQAYYNARIAILETYDREIELVDAAGEHSSQAVRQMIRDTREAQKAAQSFSESRRDILDRYADAPTELTKAADAINDLQRKVGQFIEGTNGKLQIYSQAQADEDARYILEGVRRPLQEAADELERFKGISQFRLEGGDQIADVLERALDYQDRIGKLSREEFDTLIRQEEEHRRINSLLGQRERLVQPLVDQARTLKSEFEDLLVNLPGQGDDAIKDFFKNIQNAARRQLSARITEALFGDIEGKMQDLIGGNKSGVDAAYEFLARHAKNTGEGLERFVGKTDNASTALERLAAAADNASGTLGAGAKIGSVGGSAANSFAAAANGAADFGSVLAGMDFSDILSGNAGVQPDGTIVVTGRRSTAPGQGGFGDAISGVLGGDFSALGRQLNGFIDKAFGAGVSKALGGAFAGMGTGSMASDLLDAIGIKQSGTGATIGGAIGGAIGGPIGGAIGGAIGGTIGGLFKGNRTANAVLTGPDSMSIGGKDTKNYDQASELGSSVLDGLASIADQLNATIGSFQTTIGVRGGEVRVNADGTSLKKKNGAIGFGDDTQAAIAYAIGDAIADGAIQGLSAASERILKSQASRDLQKAIEKVVAIESIPRELKRLKDPVGYAIDELNAEFVKLIGYLKEGGATAQQFAEAEELYNLKRQDAIESASQVSVDAISQFLEDMIAGPSSPLHKRTVYNNAEATFSDLSARVNAGEAVDQDALLDAARNFQDASRSLYGSSQDFFADFDSIYSLLEKAKGNILEGSTGADGEQGDYGPSPFETDSAVKALLDQLKGIQPSGPAIMDQTNVLGGYLQQIRDALIYQGNTTIPGGTSIGALPGFDYYGRYGVNVY